MYSSRISSFDVNVTLGNWNMHSDYADVCEKYATCDFELYLGK